MTLGFKPHFVFPIQYGTKIEYYGPYLAIIVDGNPLPLDEMKAIAKNDGFDSLADFLTWFNKDFTGRIIHWTDKKY